MLLMSFDASSLLKLFSALNRFFEYTVAILKDKQQIYFCYIGTAANHRLIDNIFFTGFMKFKFGKRVKTSYLSLTKEITEQSIEQHLLAQDIVFVGGGKTKTMLEIWQHKGMTAVLNKLKKEDKLPILAGVSAGGMYPFHAGLTDSTPGQYTVIQCLQWINQSFCPHSNSKRIKLCTFDKDKYHNRLSAYQAAIKAELLPPGYAVTDQCMLHIYDEALIYAFSANADNPCFFVSGDSKQEIETHQLTKDNVLDKARESLLKIGIQVKSPDSYMSSNAIKKKYDLKIL